MARSRQHGVQPDRRARRGPAHDQDGAPRARWRRHGLTPLGRRAGAVDGPLPAHYWNAPPGVNAIPGTSPELAREEEAIDHDWDEGSPGPGIATNRFVARWSRTMTFAPGDYEFAVTADDGVRLYVDGVAVIDRWIDQGPTTTAPRSRWMAVRTRSSWSTTRTGEARWPLRAMRAVGGPQRWPGTRASTGTRPMPPASRPFRTGRPMLRTDETFDFDWARISCHRHRVGPFRRAPRPVRGPVGGPLPLLRRSRRRHAGVPRQRAHRRLVDFRQRGPQRRRYHQQSPRAAGQASRGRWRCPGPKVRLRAGGRRRRQRRRVLRRVLRQPEPARHHRADPHGRRRRLQLGRRHARRRGARGQLLRPLDQVAGLGGRRHLRVHGLQRRRVPAVPGWAAGARQVGVAGSNDVHRDPPAEQGFPRDRARVLRGERGRGRPVCLRAHRRASSAPARPVRCGVLRQQHPRGGPGAPPFGQRDRLRLG